MLVNLSNLNATSNIMRDANCNYETIDNELEKISRNNLENGNHLQRLP